MNTERLERIRTLHHDAERAGLTGDALFEHVLAELSLEDIERTFSGWGEEPEDDESLEQIDDLLRKSDPYHARGPQVTDMGERGRIEGEIDADPDETEQERIEREEAAVFRRYNPEQAEREDRERAEKAERERDKSND